MHTIRIIEMNYFQDQILFKITPLDQKEIEVPLVQKEIQELPVQRVLKVLKETQVLAGVYDFIFTRYNVR